MCANSVIGITKAIVFVRFRYEGLWSQYKITFENWCFTTQNRVGTHNKKNDLVFQRYLEKCKVLLKKNSIFKRITTFSIKNGSKLVLIRFRAEMLSKIQKWVCLKFICVFFLCMF